MQKTNDFWNNKLQEVTWHFITVYDWLPVDVEWLSIQFPFTMFKGSQGWSQNWTFKKWLDMFEGLKWDFLSLGLALNGFPASGFDQEVR